MDAAALARSLWAGLGGDPASPDRLTVSGPRDALPSPFPVTAAAAAAVAVATLAAAEVWRRRGGPPAPAVAVDSRHAALACRSERYVSVVGGDLGGVWDPIAGDYRAADGWVRLHTNFRAHRAAAVRVLGLTGGIDGAAVAGAVARWRAVALEDAVHAAGGCAAALRPIAEWRASDQAAALTARPLVAVDDLDGLHAPPDAAPHDPADRPGWSRPLDGLRVLDLTRVIAGPVAGRFLAAHGADVLRVDGPAAEDSQVLVADTTVGKRATVLDIGTTRGARDVRATCSTGRTSCSAPTGRARSRPWAWRPASSPPSGPGWWSAPCRPGAASASARGAGAGGSTASSRWRPAWPTRAAGRRATRTGGPGRCRPSSSTTAPATSWPPG